ncbi:hypothetical protein [Persephonella sp.]
MENIKVESPQDILPIVEKYSIDDGYALFKYVRGYTVLSVVEPKQIRNQIFFLLKKDGDKPTFRILRYFRGFGDIGIDAEFTPETVEEGVIITFETLSQHFL